MSTAKVSFPPSPNPSILADSPMTMIDKLLGANPTSSLSLLSPSKRLPSQKMLERATPIRQARYLPVVEELNRVFEHNRPVPGSTNVKVSEIEHPPAPAHATPTADITPRAYHLTPHQGNTTPEPYGSKKILALRSHPINSLRSPSNPELPFDSILRLEINTYESAAKVHALAQSCLRLASLSIEGDLTECENYIFNAQNLLYKCLNYLNDKKLETNEELWLQIMCKVDMGRTDGEVNFTIFWFKQALKNLDRYLQHSKTPEEIDRCQEVFESIGNICGQESENSPKLKELAQSSETKIGECQRKLQLLNHGGELKPIPPETPIAKEQPHSRITIRQIFVYVMTFLIAGLAIAERNRIRNTLAPSSHVGRMTSLFNQMISSFHK